MSVQESGRAIGHEVGGWSGVISGPHRFGGTEYRIGRREIGHVHGDSLVDIPFPMDVRDELLLAGRARPHHIYPKSGWVSIFLEEESDVTRAIALLRISYGIATERMNRVAQKHQEQVGGERKVTEK
jgi:hypothetical protein